MKVLSIHNYYGSSSPSGENIVFDLEKKLLQNNGIEIIEFSRHSDLIRSQGQYGKIIAGLSTVWNPFTANEIDKIISLEKPSVVHVHNTFPMISPSIFHSIGRRSAKILTLHNYRIVCPAAIPLRRGKVCIECIDQKSSIPSIRHACYRDSRMATLPLAMSVSLHRALGTWINYVDAFIALSEFQKELMVIGGIPENKIHIKPNYYNGRPKVESIKNRTYDALYVGRLSDEKGVLTLIEAWIKWGPDAPILHIVGDGPLKSKLVSIANNSNIQFHGQVNSEIAQQMISNSKLLIVPSECYEGFPMVLREAFAFGTPTAVSNIGPLPSIIKPGATGIVFEPSNSDSLYFNVSKLLADNNELARMSIASRKLFEEKYTEEINYQIIMSIYDSAIRENEQRKP